jgi:proteasome-associated ATPase
MKGKEEFLKTGTKSVIFIDEADAILGHRSGGGNQRQNHGSSSHDTIVTQFLTMMDGISDSGCFLILATNRPDSLDPAIVREGRIDVKIPVVRPTAEIGVQLLSSYLRKRPLAGDPDQLSSFGIQQLFSFPLHKEFTAGHLLSGALCATLAELAAQTAYHRNIEKKGSIRGITHEDIETASRSLFHGMKNLDHSEAFREFQGRT